MPHFTKDEAKALWDRVTTNNQKLNDCPRHKFNGELPPREQRFNAKITCEHCGGEMRLIDVNQYIRGWIAHGGNGNEIWPGWC